MHRFFNANKNGPAIHQLALDQVKSIVDSDAGVKVHLHDGSCHEIRGRLLETKDGPNGGKDHYITENSKSTSVLSTEVVGLIHTFSKEFDGLDDCLKTCGKVSFVESCLASKNFEVHESDILSALSAIASNQASSIHPDLVAAVGAARLEYKSICENFPDADESVYVQGHLEDNKIEFEESQLEALLS